MMVKCADVGRCVALSDLTLLSVLLEFGYAPRCGTVCRRVCHVPEKATNLKMRNEVEDQCMSEWLELDECTEDTSE
ncbi:unnamed protein product [Ilex paraguariensis]|uniref:Secreted protein n=1 Tax=Ilex paraguariensis TaxID=185542 RepID=A0ABC8UWI7_9AQUA